LLAQRHARRRAGPRQSPSIAPVLVTSISSTVDLSCCSSPQRGRARHFLRAAPFGPRPEGFPRFWPRVNCSPAGRTSPSNGDARESGNERERGCRCIYRDQLHAGILGQADRKRGPALRRMRLLSSAASARASSGRGRVSASRKSTRSPRAARTPWSSAHALPARPATAPGRPAPPRRAGRLRRRGRRARRPRR
jgi:hypothetical protein